MPARPLVFWEKGTDGTWKLLVGLGKKPRVAAHVYPNGVWHTFDQEGVGGENDSEETVQKAKVEAAASCIAQGFI